MGKKILVCLTETDFAVIEQLAEKKRNTCAGVMRELVGKAIDAGLAV